MTHPVPLNLRVQRTGDDRARAFRRVHVILVGGVEKRSPGTFPDARELLASALLSLIAFSYESHQRRGNLPFDTGIFPGWGRPRAPSGLGRALRRLSIWAQEGRVVHWCARLTGLYWRRRAGWVVLTFLVSPH